MIAFTQYRMPDGRTRDITIDRPAAVEAKAKQVVEAGARFECEMLGDWKTVSLTVHYEDEDIAIELVPNGPEVPEAVDRLVDAACEALGVGSVH